MLPRKGKHQDKAGDHMSINFGLRIFLIIIGALLFVILAYLIILAILNKGQKVKGANKAILVLLSIFVTVPIAMLPLVATNVIPISLRYGDYKNEATSSVLSIHHDSFELAPKNSDIQKGQWTLINDKLTLNFKNGNVEEYYVVNGVHLYDGDTLVYRYMKG